MLCKGFTFDHLEDGFLEGQFVSSASRWRSWSTIAAFASQAHYAKRCIHFTEADDDFFAFCHDGVPEGDVFLESVWIGFHCGEYLLVHSPAASVQHCRETPGGRSVGLFRAGIAEPSVERPDLLGCFWSPDATRALRGTTSVKGAFFTGQTGQL